MTEAEALSSTRKPKVLIICTGLGFVNRGFETFFRQCFDVLKPERSLDPRLLKGAGPKGAGERALWNLHRTSGMARFLGRFLGNRPYVIEQLTFSLPLFIHLLSDRPDVIFFSDKQIGNILWHLRRLTRMKYRLLLSNGTPQRPPYSHCDHLQLLTPDQQRIAFAAGIPDDFQTLLPYGLEMTPDWSPVTAEKKISLRQELNLPQDRKVLISVGWVNENHKRMAYLVKEIASIPQGKRPFLLILGQQDEQSKPILELAAKLLGDKDCRINTVPSSQVPSYLEASDLFVLCSRGEGFGRVYLEAVAAGLQCVVHDFPNARYLLGEEGVYGDLNVDGMLADIIQKALLLEDTDEAKRRRRQDIYERFSWTKLTGRYVEMFEKVARRQILASN